MEDKEGLDTQQSFLLNVKEAEKHCPFLYVAFKKMSVMHERLFDSFLMLLKNNLSPSYSRIQTAGDEKLGLRLFNIPNFEEGVGMKSVAVILCLIEVLNSHLIHT